jgi:hypothetical protein
MTPEERVRHIRRAGVYAAGWREAHPDKFARIQAKGVYRASIWRGIVSPERLQAHNAKCAIAGMQAECYRHGHLPPRFFTSEGYQLDGRWVTVPGSEREIFPENPYEGLPPHPLGEQEKRLKVQRLIERWERLGYRITVAGKPASALFGGGEGFG